MSKVYTYTGEPVPWLIPKQIYEGYLDGRTIALRHERRLYRFPFGNFIGKSMKPLR